MLKKALCFSLSMLVTSIALADNPPPATFVVTIKNTSHYTLFPDVSQTDFENACQAATGAPCQVAIPPQGSQRLIRGAYLGFVINTPNTVHYYGAYLSNIVNNPFTLAIPNTTVTANNTLITILPADKPVPPPVYSQIPFRGINLSGAEAADNFLPSWLPSYEDAAPYIAMGANTVRFPIRWEYVTDPATSAAYLPAIHGEIADLLAQGVTVILDLHDYMRHFPLGQPTSGGDSGLSPVASEDMQQIWTTLSTTFADLAQQYDKNHQPNQLIFELMNEPYSMPTQQVLDNDNAAIQAIRQAKLNNLILIDGNLWTGLHSWFDNDSYSQHSNAEVLTPANIKDSANNWAIAVHQYLDIRGPYSGSSTTCVSLDKFQKDLNFSNFMTNYVNKYKVKVFLDEFGVPTSPTIPSDCAADMNYLLKNVMANPYSDGAGGFIGWTAWEINHGYTEINHITPAIWQQYYQGYTGK